jgi:3-oxoacyl-[acyl-carrier-protein] synthase II
MYINAASTISHQPTFRNNGFSLQLQELYLSSALIAPDYSEFIPPMERRRMSHVQKMSIACSLDCLQQAVIDQPDAIIVGTSMGCCVNAKNFLDKILSANEGPLSPTSFIVSTHNTIAGQIALLLKNHGYNMTHTQNSLSFEQSLIDGMLGIKSGFGHVLVGSADEEEETIYNMRARLKNEQIRLTCGASFFILSGKKLNPDAVHLVDVGSFGLIDTIANSVTDFLASNDLAAECIDLVLFAVNEQEKINELSLLFQRGRLCDYQKLTGTYYTNSAFAMHYGIDLLLNKTGTAFREIENILVCNNVIPENLGLILLSVKKG